MDSKEFFKEREHYTISCLRYGGQRDFEIEELYQAFKQRFLEEMRIYDRETNLLRTK